VVLCFISIETRVESFCIRRLKLTHDKLFFSFAFKFNLRHYNKDDPESDCELFPTLKPMELMGMGYFEIGFSAVSGIYFQVGRC